MKRRRIVPNRTMVFLILGLSTCGDGRSPGSDLPVPMGDSLRDEGSLEVFFPDVTDSTPRPDASIPDLSGDPLVPPSDTAGDPLEDASPDSDTAPGLIGDPCESMQDCRSGLCLDTGAGGVCTNLCLDRCPEGWVCRGTPVSGSDPIFVCTPAFWAICALCESQGDCRTDRAACREMGPDGRRCTIPCDDRRPCPKGFRCEEDMGDGRWCLPETGSCSCRTSKDQGRQRACRVTNVHGSCPGTQSCLGTEGWSPCEGRIPAPEACDGQDDDCDDLVDEGFPDLDRDGVKDCVDDDLDGDGWNNDQDNCAAVPNASQDDLDRDGLGDACDPDRDGDGVGNEQDNCPNVPNASQDDLDRDGLGDACDPDLDGDDVENEQDNCPRQANPGQRDLDQDGIGDACDADRDGDAIGNDRDNCPEVFNPGQQDQDGDGLGDLCDLDDDDDGIPDPEDNCPLVANADQGDCDRDGSGDACDPDDDNDGALDLVDCAPCDPTRFPGAVEVCNGLDDNCNGVIDEGVEWQCGAYVCDGARGCRTSCGRAEDCRTGFFCDGNDWNQDGRRDECLPKVAAGGDCTSVWECASEYCSNGHCCGAVGDLCCASDADCRALDSPPTCSAPGQCQGYRLVGFCNDSFVCRSRAVEDPSACQGSICYLGRYCDGAVVRENRACGSDGLCNQHGSEVQNCRGWNPCCDYGCSNGSCWSSFRSGDPVCLYACWTNPVACLC